MNPLRLLPIILCFVVCTLCFPASAQTAPSEIVRKVPATNAISEDLNFLTGRTLKIGSGATFEYDAGASVAGDMSEFRSDIGLAIGTNVQAQDPFLQDIADLTDPNADRIPFWDDSAGHIVWLQLGSNLAITGTTLDLTGTVAVANGGTGQTSYTDGQLLIGNTTGNTLAKANLTAGSGVTITNGAGSITISSTGALARSYLAGLGLANNASDATNDIDISPGTARGALNLADLTLSSTMTKRLDASWSAGTGNGGLDQGTIANATYHVHLIGDGAGTNDVIFSLSHDESATVTMTIASPCVVTWGTTNRGHGLVAGSPFKFSTTGALPTGVTAGTQYYVIATGLTETTFQFSATNGGSAVNSSGTQSGVHTGLAGPQMPGGYTYYRRIGSIVRASAAILPFTQDGDSFSLVTAVQDVNDTTLTTSRKTYTLASIPVGLRVRARFRGMVSHASASTIVTVCDLAEADAAPSFSAAPGFDGVVATASGVSSTVAIEKLTNTSAQICARSSASSTVLRLNTLGWIDRRGRDR